MPRFNKTGPEAKGSETGRGLGICNGVKKTEERGNWIGWFSGRRHQRRRGNWNKARHTGAEGAE